MVKMQIMKKLFLLTCITLFTFILTACRQPDLTDSQDNPIHLSDYRGKWLVVNYWATWCQPCVHELPELNGLYLSHSDQVMVLAVNFDSLPHHEINQFTQALHLKIPFLSRFPAEKYGITEISALPVTFLISPEGKLIETLHGPQTQAGLAKALGINP